jgi:hypothetical protein
MRNLDGWMMGWMMGRMDGKDDHQGYYCEKFTKKDLWRHEIQGSYFPPILGYKEFGE